MKTDVEEIKRDIEDISIGLNNHGWRWYHDKSLDQLQQEIEEKTEEVGHPDRRSTIDSELFYKHDLTGAYLALELLTDDNLAEGVMLYSPPDIDCEGEAKPDSLLYDLRKAHERIAGRNTGGYVEATPSPNIGEQTSIDAETILNIDIPYDFEEDLVRQTSLSAAYTARELGDLYHEVRRTISKF